MCAQKQPQQRKQEATYIIKKTSRVENKGKEERLYFIIHISRLLELLSARLGPFCREEVTIIHLSGQYIMSMLHNP